MSISEPSFLSLLWQLINLPHNYLYALFLLVGFGYWLIAGLGVLSFSAIDTSLDLHVDTETGAAAHSMFLSALGFAGLGRVPAGLVLSVWLFLCGALGLFSHTIFLGQSPNIVWWVWGILFLGLLINLAISLFFTALVVRPLYPLFRDYGKANTAASLVGSVGSVSTGSLSPQFGQVLVRLPDGESVELSVRLAPGAAPLPYGTKVLLVDFDPTTNLYTAEMYSE